VGGGVGRQPAGGRQLGGRRQQAGDDHGDDQVPAAVAGRAEQAIEAEAAQHAEDGGDVVVRQGAADGQGFLAGWQGRAALEQAAQTLDQLGWPVGQVEQGALFDLAGLAVGLAQQDGGRRGAVGDGLDAHGRTIPAIRKRRKACIAVYMATIRDR
jgi:hypothetical protein